MLRYFFAVIILMHGVIHVMGFAKAFNYGNITKLKHQVSKPMGMVWMFTALLFMLSVFFLLFQIDAWILTGIIAIVLSQYLIFSEWNDAKFGTLANIIILAGCLFYLD